MSEDKPDSTPPGPGDALRPTVMKAPPRRAVGRAPVSHPPAATIDAAVPTVIRGVRRERIEATREMLRTLSPDASTATCDAAARLLAETAVESLNERKAVLWCHDLQASYGSQVDATLALAQAPIVEQARAHVERMTHLLGAVDLMAVCGHAGGGVLARIARSMNDRIDTPGELATALDELRLLLRRLGDATGPLADLADALRRHAGALAELERALESSALAALFLSKHVELASPGLARRFTDRAMSLTATVAQIRQGDAVHRLQVQQPLDLIALIQNVALVMLPGLLTALGALLALQDTRGASPTEARDASWQLRDVLQHLRNQDSP